MIRFPGIYHHRIQYTTLWHGHTFKKSILNDILLDPLIVFVHAKKTEMHTCIVCSKLKSTKFQNDEQEWNNKIEKRNIVHRCVVVRQRDNRSRKKVQATRMCNCPSVCP